MRDINPLVDYLKRYIEKNRPLFDSGNLTIKGSDMLAQGWTPEEIHAALTEAEKQVLMQKPVTSNGSNKKKWLIAVIVAVVVILLLINNSKTQATLGTANQTIDTYSKGVPLEMLKFIESNGYEGKPYVVVKGDVSKGSAKHQDTNLSTSINVSDKFSDDGGSSPPAASNDSWSEIKKLEAKTKSTCEFNFVEDRVVIDCNSDALGKFLKETFKFISGW